MGAVIIISAAGYGFPAAAADVFLLFVGNYEISPASGIQFIVMIPTGVESVS